MANSQAMCTSFKAELMQGMHVFSATNPSRTVNTADTFKAALYTAASSLGAGTTTYSGATTEVTGTNYTAGGVSISGWNTPTTSGTTGFTTPTASFAWTTVTLSTAFDCVLVYNSSQSGKAVSVHIFGSQTVSAGNFTLTMPTNAAGTALLNIA